jgi:hypothetical protein
MRRDHGLTTVFCKPFAQGLGVIGAVGEQATRRSGDGKQIARTAQVVGIVGREHQGARSPTLVGQRLNLGGTSAPGSGGIGSYDDLDDDIPF